MKCSYCGGQLEYKNNVFVCNYCGSVTIEVIDAKFDVNVDMISVEEFQKKLEESRRQFVVNVNDKFAVVDVDSMVANKRFNDAKAAFEKCDYRNVETILRTEVPLNNVAVQRLLFLSQYKVSNEYEMSFYHGDIAGRLYESEHFKFIVENGDKNTVQTYTKLAEVCLANKKISNEIVEIEKFIKNEMFEEAVVYAKEMCKKYPNTFLSWMWSAISQAYKDTKIENSNESIYGKIRISREYKIATACPDYEYYKLCSDESVISVIGTMNYNAKLEEKKERKKGALTVASTIINISVFTFCFILSVANVVKEGFYATFFMFAYAHTPLLILSLIFSIIGTRGNRKTMAKLNIIAIILFVICAIGCLVIGLSK